MMSSVSAKHCAFKTDAVHGSSHPRSGCQRQAPAHSIRQLFQTRSRAMVARSQVCVQARDLNAVEKGIRKYQYNASGVVKKAAEGNSTDDGSGGGNGIAYGVCAAISYAEALFFTLAPHSAAGLFFGADALPHDYLHEVLFRLLAIGYIASGTSFLVNKAAADNDMLDDVVHRRANGSLSFFAANALFVTLITFIPNEVYPHPVVNPPIAAAVVLVSAFKWWVAGRNYAKYSEGIGANPIKIIKSFVGDFSTVLDPSKNSGLNSSIYAFLTAAFVLSGLSYQFAPIQTLTAIFGTSAGKGLEDVYLWQLLGGGLATSVGPIAYTQREAANENNFSLPNKRTLMAGLAIASAAHVAIFLPLLGTDKSGPLLFPVGFVWGVSAVASSLIAIKPKE